MNQGEKSSAKEILSVATNIGFDLLKYGAEVYRVEKTISRICSAYGYDDTHVFAIGSNITASVMDGEFTRTETRRIKSRGINLDKMAKLNDLARRVCKEKPPLEQIRKEIREIQARPIYPLWIMMLCDAVISGCFTLFFGGDYIEGVMSFFAGAAARIIGTGVNHLSKGQYTKIMTSSLIIAFIAYTFQNIFQGVDGDVIIIGAIMTLVPGIAVTNALRDFFAGDTITGLISFAESIFVAVSIAIGVAMAMVLT